MAVSPKVFRVATYNILHAFTLPHKVIFRAKLEMVTWELLQKIALRELLIIL